MPDAFGRVRVVGLVGLLLVDSSVRRLCVRQMILHPSRSGQGLSGPLRRSVDGSRVSPRQFWSGVSPKNDG